MSRRNKYIAKYRLRIREEKLLRKRRKHLRKMYNLNLLRSTRVKYPSVVKHNNRSVLRPHQAAIVQAENHFSLLENTENVLVFINSVDKIKKQRNYKAIEFDISQVTKIDIGAIGLMLSKINELSRLGIHVRGNFPKNNECKDLIYSSGFLSHMKDLKGNNLKLRQANSNLMVNRGFDKTSNKLIGSVVRKAVGHLTGIEESYRPLYSMIQEMCANSVEHANNRNKNWLFSVWYKNEKEICFTMTDMGSGVLKTIKKKFYQLISETLLRDNKLILNGAFDKKYESQTGDINRNKGLPKIKNVAIENYIKSLIVITNGVVLDFSNTQNSRNIKPNFDGTFYYWELDKECIDRWKNRNIK